MLWFAASDHSPPWCSVFFRANFELWVVLPLVTCLFTWPGDLMIWLHGLTCSDYPKPDHGLRLWPNLIRPMHDPHHCSIHESDAVPTCAFVCIRVPIRKPHCNWLIGSLETHRHTHSLAINFHNLHCQCTSVDGFLYWHCVIFRTIIMCLGSALNALYAIAIYLHVIAFAFTSVQSKSVHLRPDLVWPIHDPHHCYVCENGVPPSMCLCLHQITNQGAQRQASSRVSKSSLEKSFA